MADDAKIKMTQHPDPEFRRQQEKFLKEQSEGQREMHALMFKVGNLTYRFHKDKASEPDQEDYISWLDGLEENLKSKMEKLGFEECRTMISLKLHASERKDRGYHNYLQKHMEPEDYRKWRELAEEK